MTQTKSFLLVENDPEDQQFFIDVLHDVAEHAGCYAVATVEEALDALNESTFSPDYIFTELNLPGADGFELLRQLKKSECFRSIPVVVYTSDYSEEQIDRVKKAGAVAMFSKTRMATLPSFLKKVVHN